MLNVDRFDVVYKMLNHKNIKKSPGIMRYFYMLLPSKKTGDASFETYFRKIRELGNNPLFCVNRIIDANVIFLDPV